MNDKLHKLSLKREVGLLSAVSLVAGTMIGSGIFMSPQLVLFNIGSPGASLVIWAACGILAMLGSLCYAELGTVIKESGGEYVYIIRTSGQLVAFVFVFNSILVGSPAGIAGVSLSFAEYAVAPFFQDCPSPPMVVKCVAVSAIVGLAIINSLNVRFSMSVQVYFLVAKVLGLAVIVIGGMALLIGGHANSFENAFEGTKLAINPVGVAFYQGLWSYDGWNNLNYVTEELKHPEVNLPRAVMIAVPMVTVIYLLVNVSYLAALTPQEMMSSTAVAVTWGNKVLGSWGWVMSVAAAMSAFGSLNGSFFSGGRVCFVAAREGHMPDILSMAHVRRLTPSPALIFTTAISLVVLIPGDFQSIVNLTSFRAWIFYGITVSGLLYLKIKKPELSRPYKVPILFPFLVIVTAIFLVLAPIVDDPQIKYLYVTLFMLSSIMVYVPFIHFKMCPGILDKVTLFLQLFLEVAPTQKNV
ncbi:b(0,+)-type amino acid transporter 1-like [Megalops cyprinoides]|uniref:b(0,+)-type amino acid transporter 1-like n=1 Tax=Megalops cyprinoides TaxID=118141 RepID=UPI0018649002|nr:b(0,+)-type amino acid transporter 1-like [Megalops cyprinoides]